MLDFTSKRKRMSVIIRDEDGQIFLLCKGADRSALDPLHLIYKECTVVYSMYCTMYIALVSLANEQFSLAHIL